MAYFRGKKLYIGFGSSEIAMAAKIGAIADGSITTLTARDLAGITKIAPYKFYKDLSLQTITMPNTLIEIGERAFQGDINGLLQSVNFGNSVQEIGSHAFSGCRAITEIVLPNSVTIIKEGAFDNCSHAISVDIGNGVTTIESSAFSYCDALTSITVRAITPPSLASSMAFYRTNNCPIYVPAESVNAYKTATNWSNYASRIQAIV